MARREFNANVVGLDYSDFLVRRHAVVALGGLVVSVLATFGGFCGFKPGRGRWIFKGDKKSVAQLPSKGK